MLFCCVALASILLQFELTSAQGLWQEGWREQQLNRNGCGPTERCVTTRYCEFFYDGSTRDAVMCEERRIANGRIVRRYCCRLPGNPGEDLQADTTTARTTTTAATTTSTTTTTVPPTTTVRPTTTTTSTTTVPPPTTTTTSTTTVPPPTTTTTSTSTTTTTTSSAATTLRLDSQTDTQECGISILETTRGARNGPSRVIRRPYIQGGQDAQDGTFTWMAALLRRSRSGGELYECGAFLIDRRHLLTAAHCFRRTDPNRYGIRLGNKEWRLGRYYNIESIVVHPGYRRGEYYDDIAVVTLAEEVNDPNVVPVCLPNREIASMVTPGEGTTVVGWGAISFGGEDSPTLKVLNALPVIANRECFTRLTRLVSGFRSQFARGVTRGLICAGFLEGGRDSCGGDSGGPLMIQQQRRYYVVGIVSFGFECGNAGYPAGYTRISEYMDFIRRNTQNN